MCLIDLFLETISRLVLIIHEVIHVALAEASNSAELDMNNQLHLKTADAFYER